MLQGVSQNEAKQFRPMFGPVHITVLPKSATFTVTGVGGKVGPWLTAGDEAC